MMVGALGLFGARASWPYPTYVGGTSIGLRNYLPSRLPRRRMVRAECDLARTASAEATTQQISQGVRGAENYKQA